MSFLKKKKQNPLLRISPFVDNVLVRKDKFTSSSVNYIHIQSDGKVLVGGGFLNYEISNRNYLIRLNSDGTLGTAFCVNASDGAKFGVAAGVGAIKSQSDGKILTGGSFFDYAGITGRGRLIRLNSDGTLDTTFCNNASDGSKFSSTVSAIELQSDGKILVGGNFTNYAGTTGRNYLIRLNSDGTLDTTFCNNASDGSKFNGSINRITIQSDGKILVGGSFTNYSGTTGRSYLIRLNSDGTLDTIFCNNASDGSKFGSNISAIELQPNNQILVGGNFTNYAGTTGRSRLIRLNSDGTRDTAFCVNASDGSKFSGNVLSVVLQPNNQILIGGSFSGYGGTANRNRLIRLNSDGTLDTDFCINAVDGAKFGSNVAAIALQSDGKILTGGGFTNYSGTTGRNRLIRLNSDGTLDTDFCINASDETAPFNAVLYEAYVQSDGKILVGGSFSNFRILNRNSLIRVNSTGTLDTDFCNNAVDGAKFNGIIFDINVQSDGKILVGGSFTNYASTTGRNYLIRLNSDGTLDTTFCNNAVDGAKFSNGAYKIELQSDGKILVGGLFTNYAGTTGRNYLIRLNSDGTLDTTFCNNAVDGAKFNNSASRITIQSDGKILVGGGTFVNYAGTTGRNYLIRLNSDGTLDTDFCINAVDGAKFNANIHAIELQSDGKILVGGPFTNYAGTTGRNQLIRLNSDGTLDTDFCNNAVDGAKFNNSASIIELQSDGKILTGGGFTNYSGTTGRSYLIRLNSNGTLDTAFCINAVDGAKFNSSGSSITQYGLNHFIITGSHTYLPTNLPRSVYFTILNNSGYAK
jgi:uncharacterized delta-60 repeat protein